MINHVKPVQIVNVPEQVIHRSLNSMFVLAKRMQVHHAITRHSKGAERQTATNNTEAVASPLRPEFSAHCSQAEWPAAGPDSGPSQAG